MRLGLVYLPDAASSEACVRLSSRLVERGVPRVTLGPGRLPHVSIVHVESDADPGLLWREAERALPKQLTMTFAALAFLPYTEPYNAAHAVLAPHHMAYLIVPCTSALRDAEAAALTLPEVSRTGTTTGNGDDFMPHVTAAIWEGQAPSDLLALSSDVVPRRGVVGSLALGVIGPNGVYERTVFAAT